MEDGKDCDVANNTLLMQGSSQNLSKHSQYCLKSGESVLISNDRQQVVAEWVSNML